MPPASAPKPFPYPCTVINLDRQPERLAAFRDWNAGCGLDIERFAAVDGQALDPAAAREVIAFDPPSAGVLGNAASHKRLWERTVGAMRPHVVFEDDAVLRSDIAEALPAAIARIGGFWDILLLGFNTNSVLRLRPGEHLAQSLRFSPYPSEAELRAHRSARADVRPYRLANAFGICGYVVSPLGARKLLERCFPMRRQLLVIPGFQSLYIATLDGPMNVVYPTIDAYICLPPLVMTPNDQATSQTVTKTEKRRRPRKNGR